MNPSLYEFWLEGTVGGGRVRMFLRSVGGEILGVYYYTKRWSPLVLSGSMVGRSGFRISEKPPRGGQTGTFEGRFHWREGNTILRGTWTVAGGGSGVPFTLRSIEKPACEPSNEWKVFADPRWPITFEYPATWRPMIDGDTVRILCPDPTELLLTRPRVQLRRGTGSRTLARAGRLVRGERGWIDDPGDCAVNEKHCYAAGEASRDGMTIVYGTGEVRVDCIGERRALGSKEELTLYLLEEDWVLLSAWPDDDEVGRRVARSVRPRRPAP